MTTFSDLPDFRLTPEIERALTEDGISVPSSPQLAAFQALLSGKNLVLESGTGTGKTLAYLLPLLQRLSDGVPGRGVCLAPAAELAVQTFKVANRYKAKELTSALAVSGGNQKKQKESITKGTRLLVGTPGRILELASERKLKAISTYVLDEPEPILSFKEARSLVEVMFRPPRAQIVLVGATFGANSAALIDKLENEDELVRIKTEDNPLVESIGHFRLRVRDASSRDLQIVRFFQQEDEDRAIVYVNQSHLIRHLFRHLTDNGVSTVTLSSDRTKQQCQQALRAFSNGEVQVLLTTDRAATGIDVRGIPWVVHFELPRSTQAYVHRAGRSARAGATGRSLVLVGAEEQGVVKRLERELSITFEEFRV